MKITTDLFDAFLYCKYKAHLLQAETKGAWDEYGAFVEKERATFTVAAKESLLRRHGLADAPCTKRIRLPVLEPGHPVLFGGSIHHNSRFFTYDALQRIPGRSALGAFQYAPVLFLPDGGIRAQHKQLLAFGASVLQCLQSTIPNTGFVVCGANCRHASVRLEKYNRLVPRLLDEVLALPTADPPRLVLTRHCDTCQFLGLCKAQAVEEDNLSLLERVTEKDVIRYNAKGILTVTQLSYTFRPRKRNKRTKTKTWPFNFALQSLAIRENTVYVLNTPVIPSAPTRIYVDMEGDPQAKFVYLIGLHTVTGNQVQSYSLWADDTKGEKAIFSQFFQLLAGYTDMRIYHYGSYEARVFKRMLPFAPTESLAKLLETNTTNVLEHVYSNVYFPTYSNRLKDIGQFLGYRWSTDGATGLSSIMWRKEWLRTRRSNLKRKLLQYNDDDCRVLRSVTEFLESLSAQDQSSEKSDEQVTIGHVDALVYFRNHGRHYGRVKPAVEGFDRLIECGYFDYQRSKVYVRTHPNLKEVNRRIRRSEPTKYYVNGRMKHASDRCIHCEGRKLQICQGKRFEKLSIDLAFTKTGIRRLIVKHHAHWYRCPKCKRRFIPKTIKATHHFGDRLVSWAMYQYVVNRMTFEQIKLTAQECFGIKLPLSRCHFFKQRLADQYRTTVDKLLAGITCGPLIHADETKIRLKRISGFVWVLSNMEEVVYLYRPTRETAFLKDLLNEFNGVLVTDFYSGYDSMPCLQQKCLVHLIRDLNDDLLKNPFDDELAAMARDFGRLMQDIVSTMDRFGLRSRYLKKHKSQVKPWLRGLEGRVLVSDIAEKYRKRIVKYQDKLFVFLDQDGIPWNNNNAEHAVKPFAKYRRLINGQISERGLQDYLVLLSVQQTCRYKGVPFLDFLLSKETDIDAFCERSYSRAGRRPVRTEKVGALPIINRILKRLRLEELLDEYLPPDDQRVKVPATKALLVLLRNLLISREPLDGMGEWAAGYAPDLLDLTPEQLKGLNDDWVGRALDYLFRSDKAAFVRAVILHMVGEFGVSLQQLHDEPTTITFHGKYSHVAEEGTHHRPDVKQLAYILTLSDDGGVPVHFRMASGNTNDEQTRQETWDLLRELAGRHNFLYVADSKVATGENMAYLDEHGGRFIAVLPRTRGEDNAFRTSLREGKIFWGTLGEKVDEEDKRKVVDRFSVARELAISAEGYRLLWYHSKRKAELDALARSSRIQRATRQLDELRKKLTCSRTRYRERRKVTKAVKQILASCEVIDWIHVAVQTRTKTRRRQVGRGRPGKNTRYAKEVSRRFDLSYQIDRGRIAADQRCDGVFTLVTNALDLSESEVLLAYKRQPVTEERFSQLKTDFHVAPVYLKSVSRVHSLLCVYFLVLLVESLLERELRQAMADQRIDSLLVDAEDRPCLCPTASHLIDLFDNIQRHTPGGDSRTPTVFVTELTDLQRRILKLLDIPDTEYRG